MPFFITLQQSYQNDSLSPALATASRCTSISGHPESPQSQPSNHIASMYHNPPIASSSTSTIRDSWPARNCFSYPTSDLRLSPLRRPRIPAPTPSRSPQSIASSRTSLSHDHPTTKYSIPLRREIEPGVWSDGTDRVLSAAYPAVQDLLATARRTLCLPLPPSELVFVLAALEVFYHWNDPVHWLFWSDEKKAATAAVVNRIALRTPQLIRSKVAWNGEAEYLFILSSLHGASSLPVDKDWFQVLNPKAPSASMNLRKRKAPQAEQIEPLGEEYRSELEGARPKRPKTRSTRLVKPADLAAPENTKPTTKDSSLPDEPPTSSTTSLSLQDNTTTSNTDICSHQTSPTPDPLSLPRAGSASPAAAATGINMPAPYVRNRNRSISQTSSQTTLVAEERRSVSVLSNITAVEVHIGNGPEKVIKDDHHTSDSEEEKEGMVTRGRANKARALVQGKGASRPTKPRVKRRTVKA